MTCIKNEQQQDAKNNAELQTKWPKKAWKTFHRNLPGNTEVNRGGTVVKVLCYKSEGRWFDPSWCHWNFSLT